MSGKDLIKPTHAGGGAVLMDGSKGVTLYRCALSMDHSFSLSVLCPLSLTHLALSAGLSPRVAKATTTEFEYQCTIFHSFSWFYYMFHFTYTQVLRLLACVTEPETLSPECLCGRSRVQDSTCQSPHNSYIPTARQHEAVVMLVITAGAA